MFRMLNFFDLADGEDIGSFEESLTSFSQHLIDMTLLHSQGAVGRRYSNTRMDTDDERKQRWFFVSTFNDKLQCEKAYEYVAKGEEPCVSLHKAVVARMHNGIFSCWEDPD